MKRHTFYEFFAGGGMARAGLGRHWECLFANDFDPKKGAAYCQNWGTSGFRLADVATITSDELPAHADLVWASFPCQDLSLAGNGAGLSGKRSGAFWPFWKLISGVIDKGRKPKAIVLENVVGLLNSRAGQDFADLCETVAKSGYWVGAIVVDAKEFLPQSRPRLFIIALDHDFSLPGRMQSPESLSRLHSQRLLKAHSALASHAKASWLWFNPPPPPKHNLTLADLIEDTPDDVEWKTSEETMALLNMMSSVNRAKVDLISANQAYAIGAVYKRTRREQNRRVQRAEIRFDMAGCLRTPGGGSSRQQILRIKDGEISSRLLSARETARLMGLPDEYKLPTRYNDAYHLTGDGVAVPVVRYIAEHLIEPALSYQTKVA